MAAPFVSGAVALMMQANPTASSDELRAAINSSASARTGSGPSPGWHPVLGHGRLNVAAALNKITTEDPSR